MVGWFSRWVCLSLVLTGLLVLACGDDGRVVYFDDPSGSIRDQDSTSRDPTISVSPDIDDALGELEFVPSVEVSSLRVMAVDRVNQRRIELGRSPLKIGDSVAASTWLSSLLWTYVCLSTHKTGYRFMQCTRRPGAGGLSYPRERSVAISTRLLFSSAGLL